MECIIQKRRKTEIASCDMLQMRHKRSVTCSIYCISQVQINKCNTMQSYLLKAVLLNTLI